MPKTANKLTAKEKAFVGHYLVSLCATDAARKAAYAWKNSKVIGCLLLKKPHIAAAIKKAMDARSARVQITQDMVLQEFAKIAFSDIRRLMAWGPEGVTIKDSADIAEEDAACVSEVSDTKTDSGRTMKLKVHDKVGALNSVARHLGMFVDKSEVKVVESHEERLNALR